MLGTLNGALAARGIQLEADDITASVAGVNELRDGTVTLTRVDVSYSLRIPAGSRETVDRALARHRDRCPTARSLAGAVIVEWSARIVEADSAS
jgi:organic hydroperoxide reductase OsmC/OhrA